MKTETAEQVWQDKVRRRIADGLEAARLGRLVDGYEVFRQIRQELSEAMSRDRRTSHGGPER